MRRIAAVFLPNIDRQAQTRVAESLLAFGATAALDREAGVVWVDVTGCAQLHRSHRDPDGEPTLVKRIEEHVIAVGYGCRVAIADGPVVAAAVARSAESEATCVIAPGGNADALAPLPLRLLPLPEDTLHWLTKLGLVKVGDLAQIPRASLAVRLGAGAPRIMALLAGDDKTPLTPHLPPEVPEEAVVLEYGIESTEALLFVMKKLCDGLAWRIAGRALALSQIEIVFDLDQGVVPGQEPATISLALSTP
ncbi:MAG: hypothetical protein ACREJ3_08975, partial [Polyangiaceae bacterium]